MQRAKKKRGERNTKARRYSFSSASKKRKRSKVSDPPRSTGGKKNARAVEHETTSVSRQTSGKNNALHQPRHMHERNNNTDRRLTALTRSSPVGLFTSKNRRTWLWVSCCCCTSPSAASCCPCPRRRSAPAPSTRSSSRRLSELALPPAQSDAAGNQVKHITKSTSIINSRLRVIRLNWPREIK